MRPRYANDADLHRCRGFQVCRRRIKLRRSYATRQFGWIVETAERHHSFPLIALIAPFLRSPTSASRCIYINWVVPLSIVRLTRKSNFLNEEARRRRRMRGRDFP